MEGPNQKRVSWEHEERLAIDLISLKEGSDIDSINILSQILAFDLSRPLAVIIIDWGQIGLSDEDVRNERILTASKTFFGQSNHLLGRLGKSGALIIKSLQISDVGYGHLKSQQILRSEEVIGETAEIARALFDHLKTREKTETLIGVGNYYFGITSVKRSFKEALMALRIGRSCGKTCGIFHASENQLANLFSSIDPVERESYSTSILGAIDGETELLKTLEVFFESNLNITTAARVLFAHRNTLIYRLGKIYDLTGLDPKKFDDGVALYIALKINQLKDDKG